MFQWKQTSIISWLWKHNCQHIITTSPPHLTIQLFLSSAALDLWVSRGTSSNFTLICLYGGGLRSLSWVSLASRCSFISRNRASASCKARTDRCIIRKGSFPCVLKNHPFLPHPISQFSCKQWFWSVNVLNTYQFYSFCLSVTLIIYFSESKNHQK